MVQLAAKWSVVSAHSQLQGHRGELGRQRRPGLRRRPRGRDRLDAVHRELRHRVGVAQRKKRFNVDLIFSEDFRVGYRKLQNESLDIEGGRIVRVRRKVRGSNREWQVRIKPSGAAAVTLTLRGDRACDAPGALCTPDGRRLAGP